MHIESNRPTAQLQHLKETSIEVEQIYVHLFIFGEMANQVVQVVLRCEAAAETEHLGNKIMPTFKCIPENSLVIALVRNQMTDD